MHSVNFSHLAYNPKESIRNSAIITVFLVGAAPRRATPKPPEPSILVKVSRDSSGLLIPASFPIPLKDLKRTIYILKSHS